jgi:hypothetical protein
MMDAMVAPPLSSASRSSSGVAAVISVLVLAGALLVAIFARLMTFELRKDEELYVPPAKLLAKFHLYSDFFYNHVPGSAWLFRGLAAATGTDHLLLISRLGVLAAWVLFTIAIIVVTARLTRSAMATGLALVLMLSNDLLLGQAGMAATNNLLPLPFAYLGLGLFFIVLRGSGQRFLPMLVVGLALGFAASLKLNFVAFIPPVVLAALVLPRDLTFGDRLRVIMLPLAIGGIIGALPVLLYLAADPARFLAHVVGFHTGPHVAYWQGQSGDEEAALSIADKVKLAYQLWFSGANLFLVFVVLLVFLQLVLAKGTRSLLGVLTSGSVLTALGALVLAIVLSFLPTPSFPQYYAPPLICLLLLFTLIYGELDAGSRLRLEPALIAAAVLTLFVNSPRLLESLPKLASPRHWAVMRTHEDGVAIAKAMAASGAQGKIVTLAPIYPLEANLPVYPEFGTGPFAYRVADLAPATLRGYYKTTSPSTVEAFLAADPPAALLLGFDDELEEPLLRFAQAHNYQKVPDIAFKDRYGTAELYVKPSGTAP